jgi:DNA-binding XRE family transcriptional regulator
MVHTHQTVDERIGLALRDAREQREMAVSTLAAQADIERDTLIAIEHGTERASAAQVFRLSKVLGIELKQIFGDCCKMKPSAVMRPVQTLKAPDGINALVARMRTDAVKTRAA